MRFLWASHSHHIVPSGLIGRSSILGSIGHDNHVLGSVREATVPNEVFTKIHHIIDTSVQLMFGTKVIDTNQQGFPTRHVC